MTPALKAATRIIGLSLGCIALVAVLAALNCLIPVVIAAINITDRDADPDEQAGIIAGAGLLTIALAVVEVIVLSRWLL